MPILTRILILGLLFGLAPAFTAHAEDTSDGTLRVVRPIIRAEQDVPELCLEFDHALAILHLAKMAENIRLTADSKIIPVSSKMLDITGNQLCLTLPPQRVTYRISVSDMRGDKNEKLANTYTLSFTVPSRQSTLAFVSDGADDGILRGTKPVPVLRAINIHHVKLELFRITDTARMAEAWGHRRQTALAPSEAATFARTNGALIWQGQSTLDSKPDVLIDQPLPLDEKAGVLPSGLYLIVASAPDLRAKETDLAPVAARWVLHSNLHLHSTSDDHGLHIFAENVEASAVVRGVALSLQNQHQKSLASTVSDSNGMGFLGNTSDATLLMGTTETGDIDFLDLSASNPPSIILPSAQADITTDQTYFLPAEPVTMTLIAHDIHNHPAPIEKSELRLLQQDSSTYNLISVPAAPDGKAHITFPAPIQNGLWSVVWTLNDGRVLGESTLRVSTNPQAPHLEIASDHALLSHDGEVNLTVKSFSIDGKALPYFAGQIQVAWTSVDHIFDDWKNFHSGLGADGESRPKTLALFITDATGVAHLRLKLIPPDDGILSQAAVIRAASDPALGAIDPSPLILPLKPKDFLIGIKPAMNMGHFAENSLAQFDIVALDKEGKPKPIDTLSYHIYEIGRSFDWYQSEGAWKYKPQQQQRLIGGDALVFGSNGLAHVEWPMNTGNYRLDITDADGNRLASLAFSSGGHSEAADITSANSLPLTSLHPELALGQPNKVLFNLNQPSLITALIADDHIRVMIHEVRPKGANEILVLPTADWGNHIHISITARSDKTVSGFLTLSVINKTISSAVTKIKQPTAKILAVQQTPADTPAALHTLEQHSIAAQQSWSFKTGHIVLIGSAMTDGFSSILSSALNRIPFTTNDIGAWLHITQLWHDVIVASKLMSESGLRQRQDEMIARLVSRQKLDGSFPATPHEAGDLINTASALMILNDVHRPPLKPVINHAAAYLKQRLNNTWFDEKERADRVSAYLALASVGQVDVANLHYFSDSSVDKKLSPLAALQLSAAFGKTSDKDKALFWLNAAALTKKASTLDALLLPWLADNSAFDLADLAPAMTQESKKSTHDFIPSAAWLTAMSSLQARAPAWHIAFNGADKAGQQITAFALAVGGSARTIHNLGAQPVVASTVDMLKIKTDPSQPSLTRHIYRPDGGEVLGRLQAGATYVVVLEFGSMTKSKTSFVLRDDTASALRPTTCTLSNNGSNTTFVWLPKLSVPDHCEVASGVLEAVLTSSDDTTGLRVAYLARAETDHTAQLPEPYATYLP